MYNENSDKPEKYKSLFTADLVSEVLESTMADSRYNNTQKWLNHEDVWSDS